MNLIQYLTPTNLAEEKARFFASKDYNPVFTYDWDSLECTEWALNHAKYHKFAWALVAQDVKSIEELASAIFDTKITPELLGLAKGLVKTTPEKLPTHPDEIVTAFTDAFKKLGLDPYAVEIVDQQGFNIHPSGKRRKVFVSKYLNPDFFTADGEVKHEMVHIIRYENGKFNGITKSDNFLPTEEGLATYAQDYTGEKGETAIFQHAAEYTMTEVARVSSLREVHDYLLSIGFSSELAYQRAERHKFGFKDTRSPGDILKPSMYFYHEQIVKRLSSEEKYRLMVGKIAKDQLKDYPVYKGKVPLESLKEYYNF